MKIITFFKRFFQANDEEMQVIRGRCSALKGNNKNIETFLTNCGNTQSYTVATCHINFLTILKIAKEKGVIDEFLTLEENKEVTEEILEAMGSECHKVMDILFDKIGGFIE